MALFSVVNLQNLDKKPQIIEVSSMDLCVLKVMVSDRLSIVQHKIIPCSYAPNTFDVVLEWQENGEWQGDITATYQITPMQVVA